MCTSNYHIVDYIAYLQLSPKNWVPLSFMYPLSVPLENKSNNIHKNITLTAPIYSSSKMPLIFFFYSGVWCYKHYFWYMDHITLFIQCTQLTFLHLETSPTVMSSLTFLFLLRSIFLTSLLYSGTCLVFIHIAHSFGVHWDNIWCKTETIMRPSNVVVLCLILCMILVLNFSICFHVRE